MRGVFSSDSYFGLVPVRQFHKPCSFTVKQGTPLCRVLPVPRLLLKAGYRKVSIADAR